MPNYTKIFDEKKKHKPLFKYNKFGFETFDISFGRQENNLTADINGKILITNWKTIRQNILLKTKPNCIVVWLL